MRPTPESRCLWRSLASVCGLALLVGASPAVLAHTAPEPQEATQKAAEARQPNVLIWMMDDVGFGQIGCFGGLIETPNIDRVAALGLRYSNYHTPAVCSASRAAMLTGRNPHTVHMGGHPFLARPFPGYDGKIPSEYGTIAANLRESGYTTFALGKWDHLPASEMSPAGRFRYWPLKQGFDRFYGFLAADTDNWNPTLVRDNSAVPAPVSKDYHLSRDLADEAIGMIHSREARDGVPPFFLYFATGAMHAPHHAPAEWIKRYEGRFDEGWDKIRAKVLRRQVKLGLVPRSTRLAPRPEGMPAWDSLSADQKRLYARQMEVFAAALSFADAQFGRILDALEAAGDLGNTVILILSDNGASAEGAENGTYHESLFGSGYHPSVQENLALLDKWGGPGTFPHYALGWAVAGNTPYRYYKQTTYEGGTHVPLVMAWPKGLPVRNEIRDQFVFVSDIAPTILELAKAPLAPVLNHVPQKPMEGISFAYTLTDGRARTRRGPQYFELFGNKGLWDDDWSIVTRHRVKTWDLRSNPPFANDWELYNLAKDPGQTRDLAQSNPERVAALAREFEAQADRFNVNPIANPGDAFVYVQRDARAEFKRRQGIWSFQGPTMHVSAAAAPPTISRPFRMSARIELPSDQTSGPIYAQGGALGGMGLYLNQGVPAFVLRTPDGAAALVSASESLTAGSHNLELDLQRKVAEPMAELDCAITISADGRVLATQSIACRFPTNFSGVQAFDIGLDFGSPVTEEYPPNSTFGGTIHSVEFNFNR